MTGVRCDIYSYNDIYQLTIHVVGTCRLHKADTIIYVDFANTCVMRYTNMNGLKRRESKARHVLEV